MVRIVWFNVAWFAAATLVLLGLPFSASAQQERPRSLSELHAERGLLGGLESGNNAGGLPGMPAGGASLANFTELMRLIETTIAPDQWANAGGTATMSPFRSGVRIEPNGLIARFEDIEQVDAPKLRLPKTDRSRLGQPTIRLDELGAWQQRTALRWVSLHQLDAQLQQRLEDGLSANIAMELLGGLCRIDYVAFDAESGEWMLGGPAGSVAATPAGDLLHSELKLPPILLEDLLAVAPHVLRGQGEFGCTIDPVQERLVAAYKMAREPVSIRNLRSDPDRWAEEWKAKIGRQRATIIGLPKDSPTGYALLIADAHMKRVALGLEPSVDGLKNYWLESDLVSQQNKGSMVRWWFSISDTRIPCDTKRNIYHFESSNVCVLSEAQMLNQQGQRVVADRADWAADAFARNFTTHFEGLQQTYPIYGRLRHIVDLAVALEIVRAQIAAGVGKPLRMLENPELQTHMCVAPTEIDSVVATRRSSDGTVSAMVSGGVSIASQTTRARLREHAKHFETISLESSPGEREQASDPAVERPFWR